MGDGGVLDAGSATVWRVVEDGGDEAHGGTVGARMHRAPSVRRAAQSHPSNVAVVALEEARCEGPAAGCLEVPAALRGGRQKGRLVLATLLKDQAHLARAWVAHHASASGGLAAHFVLYDNGSADGGAALLRLRDELGAGLVTVVPWDVRYWEEDGRHRAQPAMQAHATRLAAASGCSWLALLDLDEYLVAPGSGDVEVALRAYDNAKCAALAVECAWFGCAGAAMRRDSETGDAWPAAGWGRRRRACVEPWFPHGSAESREGTMRRTKLLVDPRLALLPHVHSLALARPEAEVHTVLVPPEELRFNHYFCAGGRACIAPEPMDPASGCPLCDVEDLALVAGP